MQNHIYINKPISWRLIEAGPCSGPENMAIDEALLRCSAADNALPVLRFYGWSPPALSVGRFQDVGHTVDLERCQQDNLPIVRRMTGGGAIYHADELTYSLVCTPAQLNAGTLSVKEAFFRLTRFLLDFYRLLGLNAAFAQDAGISATVRLGERSPFCFAGRESCDILINGKKIGGNAQRRTRTHIFQHGSIPLVSRAGVGVSYMRDKAGTQLDNLTSLAELGISADPAQLGDLLKQAWERQEIGLLQPDRLTAEELQIQNELLQSIYLKDSWNIYGERE